MVESGHAISLTAIPLLFGAALCDVTTRRVPNWCSVLVVVIGSAARLGSGNLTVSAMTAVSVFLALYFCWTRGWLGGGDVKLLAASVLLVPVEDVVALGLAVSLSGGLLALVYLAGRDVWRWRPTASRAARSTLRRVCRVEAWRIRRGAPLPYACAIAAGGIFTIIAG